MLPKNKIPTYELTLPVSKKKITFRPWVSVENKKILTSLITKEANEIENAILEVLTACTFDQVDLEILPNADVEYLFIKIKSKAKGEVIELTYQANQERDGCTDLVPVELDLNTVTVTDIPDQVIVLSKENALAIKLNFPTILTARKIKDTEDDFEKIAILVESIFYNKEVFTKDQFTLEEMSEWLKNLTEVQFDLILNFMKNIPSVQATISFIVNNKEKVIKLTGINDFFL